MRSAVGIPVVHGGEDVKEIEQATTAATKPSPLCLARIQHDERKQIGFEIGWDAFFHQIGELTDADNHVRDGYRAAAAHFERPKNAGSADRYCRKQVYLRYSAYKRGLPFDKALDAAFLETIDREYCPVTFEKLTHCTLTPSDASIDRIDNGLPYEMGNVACMSVRANKIKDRRTMDEMVAISRLNRDIDGLKAIEWRRLVAVCVGTHNKRLPIKERLRVPMVTTPLPMTHFTPFEAIQYDMLCKSMQGDRRPCRRHLEPRSHKGQAAYLRLCNKLHHALANTRAFLSAWDNAELYAMYCEWWDYFFDERQDSTELLYDFILPPRCIPEEAKIVNMSDEKLANFRTSVSRQRQDLVRSFAKSVRSYDGVEVDGQRHRQALACSGAVLSALGVVQ
jgi:hypothetical protein